MNRPYIQIHSAEDVRTTADRLGSHFFSPDTMAFFKSRLLNIHRALSHSDGTGTDTGLIVTSEQFVPLYGDPDPRTYTVRFYELTRDAEGRDHIDIRTIEEAYQLPSRAAAERFVRQYPPSREGLAGDDPWDMRGK